MPDVGNPATESLITPVKRKWVPLAVIAGTCVALALPAIYLHKSREKLFGAAKRVEIRSGATPLNLARARSTIKPTLTRPLGPVGVPRVSATASPATSDDFSPALHAAQALGIATMMVSFGAVTTVWIAKEFFGIRDAKDFGDVMRRVIDKKMGTISANVYRPGTDETPPADPSWTWKEAEGRLQRAYQKDGLMGWIDAAVEETEAESSVERERKHRRLGISKADN